jgi:hypothetical protein
MNLKKAVAGVSLASGVGLALIGVGSGVAYAAPGGDGCRPPLCAGGPGPGGPGPGPGRGRGDDRGPVGRDRPDDFRGPGDRGGPGDFRGPGDRGGPGDFRGPGDRGGPGDFRGPPPDAFRGFRGAPWGDGAAPWGWGAPPRAGWGGPFPPPGGRWDQGPINYWGYSEQPIWDQGQNGWGFYFFGIWIPL